MDHMGELMVAEAKLTAMVSEVSRLSGESMDDIYDSLGIGHISMVSLVGCEESFARLAPVLDRLRRNNPRRLPGTKWRRVEYGLRNDFPELAACYAVYGDGRLLYVGSTENLSARFKGHSFKVSSMTTTPWGTFHDVVVKYRPRLKYGDWAMVELRLIKRLQPAGNIRGIRAGKTVRP